MKELDFVLWVDDTKNVPKELNNISNEIILCRTYQQAIDSLDKIYQYDDNDAIPKVLLCLDYHLGSKKTGTGLGIAKYIEKNHMPITCFWIVSIYPEGKEAMQNILSKYYPYETNLKDVVKRFTIVEENKTKQFLLERCWKWFKSKILLLFKH